VTDRFGVDRARTTHVQITGQSGSITEPDTQSETVLSVQTFGCPPQPCLFDTECPCSARCIVDPAGGSGYCSSAGSLPIVTVTDNDETTEEQGGYLVYTSSDRFIYPGASFMGWQVSDDGGGSFYYGGKLRPPAGWSVLWGDPAIASSRANQNFVFLSNIAVPASKFPSIGYIEGPITTGCLGTSCIGGACIARSVDAGHTFTLSAADCLTNQNHFYDGGAIETDNDGGVYAAWVDWDTNKIDVWRATTLTGSFAQLPNPFPGFVIQSHPRLVFEPLNQRLYLVAQADTVTTCWPGNPTEGCANIYITYWDLGSETWSPPGFVAYGLNQLNWNFGPAPQRRLRGAPEFSFASAQASMNGDDNIRIAYTYVLGGRHVIHVSRCTWGQPGMAPLCVHTPEWGSDYYAGEHFNPVVSAQHGFPPIETEFVLSYTTSGTSTIPYGVGWAFGELAVTSGGIRFFVPQVPYDNYEVCPDNRGYWGDYDNMEVLYAGNLGTKSTFIRAHTDSSSGVCTRQQYTSRPVHASAITWP
jgi:hypothetical protein